MKSIAIAFAVVAGLSGCAVVPIGPPVVVGARGHYGYAPPVYAPSPYYNDRYGRRPYWRR
jgi:uncharacterized protein YceK